MTLILTTPSNTGTTTVLSDTIPPLTTKIVDSAMLYDNSSVKWLVDITNTTTGEVLTQQIFASRINSHVRHTRYGILGDILPHIIEVILDPSETILHLRITNTNTDSYHISTVR